jgi:glycosyltransferase 2 family protein
VYIHKYAPNHKTHATLSIIMDRVLGLLILICASLLVIPWQFEQFVRNGQINSIMFGLLIILGSCVVVGLIIIITPFYLAPSSIRAIWNKIPYRHIIEHVISGFRQHGVALKLTLASLAAGIAMTAVLVAASYCIGIGIGLTVTYIQMLVIMTVIICVISLPISIGGHGVREGISVVMFSAFGVVNINQQLGSGQEPAILFSLLFFAIPLIWSVLGGIVYLIFRHDYDHTFLRDN